MAALREILCLFKVRVAVAGPSRGAGAIDKKELRNLGDQMAQVESMDQVPSISVHSIKHSMNICVTGAEMYF